MKKKLVVLLAAAVAVMTVITGCGNKATTSDNGSTPKTAANEEKAKGDTFTVGFDAEYPPYGYMDDNGEYVGFDLDLAQEVCDRNGWELVKKPIDWDSKDMELESGSIDCIWNGFTMTGREDDYTWSEPYLDNAQIFLVSADSDITTQEDLSGKNVDVQAGSAALAALKDQEGLVKLFANLTEVPDYNTAVMELESGAVDAVAIDRAISYGYIKDGKVKALQAEISKEQYAIGFKLGNTELRDQVQKTMDEMIKDGTVDKIAANYEEDHIPESLCTGK
ncbi:MAG: amino acid ABC transporter substrate-binding protein [Hespellia sp.]|nr:amino acid ABC transporter substrate-binding protein [Hespellia sp.]